MARTSAGISEALSRSLDAIAAQVRLERAVAVRSLGLGKLTRSEQVELLSALGRAGLEHTGKMLRVPLGEQVLDTLTRAEGQSVHETSVAREVRGARNAGELRLTIQGLLEEGAILKLVDETGVRLAPRTARALTSAELDQLAALAKRLGVLARATKARADAPRPTLARSTLEAPRALLNQLAGARDSVEARGPLDAQDAAADTRAAARAQRAAHAPGAARDQNQGESVRDALQETVLAAFLVAPAASGLIRVPDLVRALEGLRPRAALVAAVSALARRGELELRPEASIGRLAQEERARCPSAPDGTPLSCARLTQPATGVRT